MKFNQIKKSIVLVFSLVITVFYLSSCSSSKGARKCNGSKMIKTNMN